VSPGASRPAGQGQRVAAPGQPGRRHGPHPGFEAARRVADAVLYEGYLLYPYRASAAKNQVRWQFGVLAPRCWVEAGGPEAWSSRTEVLVRPRGRTRLDIRVRALRIRARQVEEADDGGFRPVAELGAEGRRVLTWDEGVEVEADWAGVDLGELMAGGELVLPLELAGEVEEEPVGGPGGRVRGRVVRRCLPVTASLALSAAPVAGASLVRVRLDLANLTPWSGPARDRDEALRHSLVGAHLLLGAHEGSFVSLTDPPPDAAAAAAACENRGCWPVLAGPPGEDDVVLSSPIILADHPEVAPESREQLCDATEIDEILTLRIMTLTEEEKEEARATDEAARRILDHADTVAPEVLGRLHGAIRSLRPLGPGAGEGSEPPGRDEGAGHGQGAGGPAPPGEWEPLGDLEGDDPLEATVPVGALQVGRGWRVRLRPGRRADAMDLFLAGREATVAGVYRDPEGQAQVGVVLDGSLADPAGGSYQRPFFFHPDEIEVLGPPGPADSTRPARQVQERAATRRVLVAGVGNVFLSDDGFGPEVARRLEGASGSGGALVLPPGVEVADVGIAGVHLAYELLDPPDLTILVDTAKRGGPPGTLYVIEPDPPGQRAAHRRGAGGEEPDPAADAHAMDPEAVLALVGQLGGTPPPMVVVGCEPASLEEGMGLSPPVAAAVDEAVALVGRLAREALEGEDRGRTARPHGP